MAGGASNYHTIAHMQEAIHEKNFRANIHDVTHELGILSIQGQTLTIYNFVVNAMHLF